MKTNWDEVFLTIAFAMASASHCVSRSVGAVIVKDRRIISTGINGTAHGCTNCDEVFPQKTDPGFDRAAHHEFNLGNEIHAEMNAILFSARNSGGIDGATLYCTLQPCGECLKNILQSGITRVVYAQSYDLAGYAPEILKSLKKLGVRLEHVPLSAESTTIKHILQSIQ